MKKYFPLQKQSFDPSLVVIPFQHFDKIFLIWSKLSSYIGPNTKTFRLNIGTVEWILAYHHWFSDSDFWLHCNLYQIWLCNSVSKVLSYLSGQHRTKRQRSVGSIRQALSRESKQLDPSRHWSFRTKSWCPSPASPAHSIHSLAASSLPSVCGKIS